MQPTDVRADLAATARPGPIPPPPDAHDRPALLAGISASYFRLRRGLAIVAFALPIVLALGARGTLQGSISAYYHYAAAACDPGPCPAGGGTMRDVFVGGLWMIGSFLIFYRGYSVAEDRALNLAGLAAVVIAISPMDWPPGAPATFHGEAHGTSAVLFFLSIAYVAIFRARDTSDLLAEPARRRFLATYRTLGALMVLLPLGAVALHLLLHEAHSRVTLAVEVSGIYVFAAFWLVKSREIAAIERGA